MKFIQKFRLAWRFARHQAWDDRAIWEVEDAIALNGFLRTQTGKRLSAVLANTVIQQQASAVSDVNNLQTACGYANGQAGLVRLIEMMAEPESISSTETDPEQDS